MAVETTTAARVWAPPGTMQDDTLQDDVVVSNSSSEGWLGIMRTEVFKHLEVEDLYVSIDDDMMVDYWIIIPRRDIGLVRTLIESQQRDIIRLFAKTENPPFQLDFHIIYQEGRDSSELVPSDAIHVPKV